MTDIVQKPRLNFPDSANVLDYGADRDGVINSSQAFIDAANSLPNGGVISIPSGKYIVEGLPCRPGVYWKGVGVGKTDASSGTYLILPVSPSQTMFRWDSGAISGYGGGISGCTLEGNNTIVYDAIDLSSASAIHRFVIEYNLIRGFRNGYLGSADDRSTLIQFNNFWFCVTGLYITNNHPHLTAWNDFRDCTTGIAGLLVDSHIANQNFVYCVSGISAISTTVNTQRSLITGCIFGYCTGDGIVAGQHTTITGCLFIPRASNALSGVRVINSNVNIVGCQFDTDGGIYSEGAISVDCDYRASAIRGLTISSNTFRLEGSNIVYHKASAATRDISSSLISNNVVIDSLSLIRRSSSFGSLFYTSIIGNTIRYEGSTLTNTLTGTITFTTASATVTGVGSLFLSQLQIGDLVRFTSDSDATDWRRVSAIASNVSLTLSTVYAGAGGAGVGVSSRDGIHIHSNAAIGNVISSNIIAAFSATPTRMVWGIGGQLGQSCVIGNYVRRGIAHVDTASSGSAQIANNVYQA